MVIERLQHWTERNEEWGEKERESGGRRLALKFLKSPKTSSRIGSELKRENVFLPLGPFLSE